MSIQILGFRESFNRQKKKIKRLCFFERKWRANSIPELLDNIDEHIEKISKEERFNLFFTIADCLEEGGRKMQKQDCIFFDIDNIDVARAADYVEPIAKGIGVSSENLSFIMTGNGLHVLVQFKNAWDSTDYYDLNRDVYKAICNRITTEILSAALLGFVDPMVFADTRMVRLPKTINKKEGKPENEVQLIHHKLKPIEENITDLIKVEKVEQEDQLSATITDHYMIDTEAVLSKCGFLKYNSENPEKVLEPEWYADMSIRGRLEDGEKLVHEASEGHPSYDKDETELKLEQALLSSGPRTCDNISTMFGGCKDCPYKAEVKSPIMLRGENFLRTQQTGFRKVARDKQGNLVRKAPDYDDLVKYFDLLYKFKTDKVSKLVYTYKNGYYSPMEESELEGFVEETVVPSPKANEVSEFVKKVRRNNLVPAEFFINTGKINCSNGVLDLGTFELSEHTPELGFTYKLEFEFSASAKSPVFDKFLNDICSGDKSKADMLMEYFGYCVSSTDPRRAEKALIMVGEGANGKSVLINTLGELVGEENYSTLNMHDLKNEQMRAQLQNKLFNLSEETPRKSLNDSSDFKNLISGGAVNAKIVHLKTFSFKNKAKFVFCCNELPRNFDTSYGMGRRLMIAEFKEEFSDSKGNIDRLLPEKLQKEMSGILNRVIEGYQRLVKDDFRFTICEQSRELVEQYRLENNNVEQWVLDRCSKELPSDQDSSWYWYELSDFYFDYTNWMRENNPIANNDTKARNQYSKMLRKVAPTVQIRRMGKQNVTHVQGLLPIDSFAVPKRDQNGKTL